MLFNIEFDYGDCIEGYLIPDGYSETPAIRVLDADGEIGVFSCDQSRPAVAAAGRHQTGVVGFRLDETKISDLAARRPLTVQDAKSGLLIYRRLAAAPINQKLVRLETQLLPMTKIDRYCGSFFQYELSGAERYGHETALQAFHLNAVDSIYISGRLLMRNYEEFLGRGFEAITFLFDPYYEMALRIFLFKRMNTAPAPFLGERDKLIFGSAVDYFRDVNLDDERAMKVALKKAPPQVASTLSSPVTRQLVTSSPEQSIGRRDIAPAIDLLSRFTIVGHSDNPTLFQLSVGQMLGIPVDDLIVPPRHLLIDSIAAKLRAIPAAETLLEEDLIFDHYVRQAMTLTQPGADLENAKSQSASTN